LDHLSQWAAPHYLEMDPLKHLVISMTGHGRAALYYDPLGVCLIMGAWNYPFHLTMLPVVGAIAAGNTVLIKTPSEKYGGATARLLGEIVPQYLDVTCVQVVEGAREMNAAVLKPRYDHIFFTGGSLVGKMVSESAARHMTPTVLELGGKSPCIVDKSANLSVVAQRMMWGKFTNAGQTCVAADHVYVHQDVAEKFIECCKDAITSFYGEDPQKSGDLARIINKKQFESKLEVLEDGDPYKVCGGEYDAEDLYIAPTLLNYGTDEGAWDRSKAMEEEIFGPILPMLYYSNLGKVINRINSQEKPLAMYIFANDSVVSERLLRETTAGHAVVNDILLQFCAPIPFGGVGNSGMGSYHGEWSFKTFSHEKGVLKRHVYGEIPARFPPYGVGWKKLLVSTLTYPFPAKYVAFLKIVLLIAVLRFTPLRRIASPILKNLLLFLASFF